MPRKYTSRNRRHPHYLLKQHLENTKKQLRILSSGEFQAVFDHHWSQYMAGFRRLEMGDEEVPSDWPRTRATQMEWMLARYAVVYKQEWQKHWGWAFDDVYDETKYAAHMKAHMQAKQAAQQEAERQAVQALCPTTS